MQEDELSTIIKTRQVVAQVQECKTIRSKRKSIVNMREFVSRFEPLLYVPAFTTMKDFH